MKYRAKQRILKRGIWNGHEAPKGKFKVLNYQGNANSNNSEIQPYTNQND